MALRLFSLSFTTSTAPQSKLAQFSGFKSAPYIQSFPKRPDNSGRRRSYFAVRACAKPEENNISEGENRWGKVSAVLFDMDGVLCNSEDPSRRAAVHVFAEMGIQVTVEDFAPFTGMGEANFLGGVAKMKGVKGFNPDASKKRFFEIYLDKYAKPNSGIGFPGAFELVTQCKSKGLKVAVASSADRIKVDANLTAAGFSLSMFDAIVSADAFENLKPAPDIFLAASKILNVPPSECVVIEDALAGIQAAKAAKMRCIAVTTTLSESIIEAAAPSLIRKGIDNISLDDILCGGSGSNNAKMQGSQPIKYHVPSSIEPNSKGITPVQDKYPTIDSVSSFGGVQVSRRNVVRYTSFGIAVSCLLFIITNWKAMQYTSPKAIWNFLFGISSPPFGQSEGTSRSQKIQQLINYISDLEARNNVTTVPEFPSKIDWLNTSPLQLGRDLRGKIVLLDFWTYCCINCIHVLPDLGFLEKKYKDMPFVVVGVHSAKFDNEKDLEAIRNAVLRYEITHPVVNDGEMVLWRELGINSWPTFAVVGPNGKLLAQVAGEGHRKDLDDLVEAALLFYGRKKLLNGSPIPLKLERDNDPRFLASPLKFPGKLAVDVLNNRLFISDSNHNRIVVTDFEGNYISQVGSTGEEGLRDGSFDEATFNRPQGLSYNAKKNLLYVADTENHALRVIDFVNETVRTLAGNGTKGSDYEGGGAGTTQVLNSPWDVCFEPESEIVYIAMAGLHQIWEHYTIDGTTKAFSGDGYERNLNGKSSRNTSFAQPSGISLSSDRKEAYVADSESSSIRAVNLRTGGSRLLAGGDPNFSDNLFRFGDIDGIGSRALLQHPLGVLCGQDGQIYIADSYNHKIKKLDPVSRAVSTIAGTGHAGLKDGASSTSQLSEPAGIAQAENGRLFIADTNNNLIRYLDLNDRNAELHTLSLNGVLPPATKSRSLKRLRRRSGADTQTIVVDGSSSKEALLHLQISVPKGYHFSKEAQSKFSIEVEPEDAALIDPMGGNLSTEGSADAYVRRSLSSPSTTIINCKVYYCKDDDVCLYQSLTFEIPFGEMNPDASPAEISLPYLVKPKVSTW